MATETVLISIELEKGQQEQQVDTLTKKILSLTDANKQLAAEQKKLESEGKKNSEQYVENSRQIEINKQKINEATASRKNLVTQIIAEDNSLKGLKARNAELIKQRDQISISTEEGRQKIAQLNAEIDKNTATIKANSSATEKQRMNVGNYIGALDQLVPGLGATTTGIINATKAAWAFVANPIGAVIAALGLAVGALIAYFKGSEEGQNRWNKIAAIGAAILEQFMNVAEAVGEAIYDMFANPKQAMESFVGLLRDQIVNRFEGMLELIPELAKAVKLLFEGEFEKAGQTAGDAVGKVTLGIENATEKIGGLIEETAAMVEEGIKFGEALAAINAKIDADERALIIDRQKFALDVAKKRQEALTLEGAERKKVLMEAIALEEDLSKREVALARLRKDAADTALQANGDDKEAKKELAEATAAVFAAEATAFENTLRFRKQIAALDEEDKKKAEDRKKAKQKEAEDELKAERERLKAIAEAEQEQFENNLVALEERNTEELNLIKEKYIAGEISKAEYEQAVTDQEIKALEARRTFLVANNEDTLAIDTALIDAKIKNKEREAAATEKLNKAQEKAEKDKFDQVRKLGNDALRLAKEHTLAYRLIASANVVLDTYKAAQAANAGMVQSFPGPVGVALGIAAAAVQVGIGLANLAEINGVKFAKGGIAQTGGVLNGPSHARGGIPFAVGGRVGFEAEGGEAIINKNSTRMFRRELSAINEAGGGVRFAVGGILGDNQTRTVSAQIENRAAVRDLVENAIRSMPPIVVTVEDINAKQDEVNTTQQLATVV